MDWYAEASRLIKAELAKKGVGYPALAQALVGMGVKETTGSINAKINRGAFSFAFFLQVMTALDVKVFRVGE